MTIDLMTIPATEAERLAYAEGFTRTATLFARIADLEATQAMLDQEIENLRSELKTAESDLRDAISHAESLAVELAQYRRAEW
jgi:chromosome segregation ATPase